MYLVSSITSEIHFPLKIAEIIIIINFEKCIILDRYTLRYLVKQPIHDLQFPTILCIMNIWNTDYNADIITVSA
jgi:hypothetical protein